MFVASAFVLTSTAAAATITIAWDPNPEPTVTGYIVYVGSSAGTYTSSYDVGKTTTFTLPNAVAGTTYHMAVRAYSSGTDMSPMSADLSASLAAATTLTAPTLVAPVGTTTSPSPTFTWAAVPNATSYFLGVSDTRQNGIVQQVYSAAAAGCSAGTGTCAVTPAATLATGSASWAVVPSNSGGDGPWSATRSFTVGSPLPTTTPTLVAPVNTATSQTPTFSWSAVPNATSYFLGVSDARQSGVVQQVYSAAAVGCGAGTGTCSITPTVSLATGTANWAVLASNAAGDGPWSATRSFTVGSPLPTTAPTLVAPVNTATSQTPTFSWSAVPNATSYYLGVSDARQSGVIKQVYSAAAVGCGAGTGTCSITPAVSLAPGTANWAVVASNAAGDGPWSATRSFTVGSPLPTTAPTLVAPVNTATSQTPTFSWSAVPNATSYYLGVSDARQSGVIKQVYSAAALGCGAGTGTCSVTPAVSLAPGTANWAVVASNTAGDGPWSATRSFTVGSPLPTTAPTLVAPVNTATSQTPTFSWSAVPNATSYYLGVTDTRQSGVIQQVYSAAAIGCGAVLGHARSRPV